MKNSFDTIWDRTSDLPLCSTAPWPLYHRGPPAMLVCPYKSVCRFILGETGKNLRRSTERFCFSSYLSRCGVLHYILYTCFPKPKQIFSSWWKHAHNFNGTIMVTLICVFETCCGRCVVLALYPLLVPWSTKSRAIPLLPLWAVRHLQSLSACTLPFYYVIFNRFQYGRHLLPNIYPFCM